jgi:hypothetical protein
MRTVSVLHFLQWYVVLSIPFGSDSVILGPIGTAQPGQMTTGNV